LRRLAHKHSRLVSRVTLLMTQNIDDPIERAGASGYFAPEHIDDVARVVFDEGHASPRYRHLEHAHMTLPSWFQRDLDPYGPAYAEQQKRLWKLIAGVGRDYEPELDEKEAPLGEFDPVRFPGLYLRRDAEAVASASDHFIASGMILKHAGLKPGGWALEYGAGFGQTALALARLGVNVDTVDISRAFCQYVQQQADHFQVPLNAHHGHFGMNPRPGQRYDLVFFYESFHHCLDWQGLLAALPGLLASGGRVILCGEPMAEREYAAVPYPWGVRLQSDVVATIRRLRWFELGFSEDFLYEIFTRAGFSIQRHACEPSLWGRTYVCQPWAGKMHLGRAWLPPVIADGWHGPEADGRWSRSRSRLALPGGAGPRSFELDLANPHAEPVTVELRVGRARQLLHLAPGQERVAEVSSDGFAWLELHAPTRRLGGVRRLLSRDHRELGVFVRRLRAAGTG
jgi:2-polyprenyl-3-methyl-5-hydroxy-6-metoxy-1,4-benzoquinol methylase